jgi:hypothetical protein
LSVGEKAVVANADEAFGQDVKEKAADELQRIENHGALSARLGVVLPAKGDLAVVNRDKPLVGDGDPVGVAREVLEHLLRAAEGRLGVDDPVFAAEVCPPACPTTSSRQRFELTMEGELALVEGLLEIAEELAPEETAQGADG